MTDMEWMIARKYVCYWQYSEYIT